MSAGWQRWREHLASRREPEALADLLPRVRAPLAWAWPASDERPVGPDWLEQARKLAKEGREAGPQLERAVLGWLADASGQAADPRAALGALACAHALPWLAGVVSPEVWWAALDQLLIAVTDATAIELETSPVVHQLIAGELALTLAYLLPEVAICRKLRASARRALSSGLEDLLDGEGLPRGCWLAHMRCLLACWTRAFAMGREMKRSCFSSNASLQYEWLVRQSLRLLRHDGTPMFPVDGEGADVDLLQTALRFAGDADDRKIARLVLPGQKKPLRKDAVARVHLPVAAYHSEWAGVSVLRPDWSRGCQRLAVIHDSPAMRVELVCGRDVVFSGISNVEVRLQGRAVESASEWRVLCWESDEDMDYLELEKELADGVQIQRQIALAREDRFLLLADAVVSRQPGPLDYQLTLPLGPKTTFQPAEKSHEGVLRGTRRRARVMPLALPEWRNLESPGELTEVDGQLQLKQQGETALYASLFFDLQRDRLSKRFTWRRLTVAEQLKIVPRNVAVGYRVGIGHEQWLIYRAIAGRGNRTVLGHNLTTESLIARFDETGEPERLLEID